MWNKLKNMLMGQKTTAPQTMTIRVDPDELIKKMKLPKDVILAITTEGYWVATCKACKVQLNTAENSGLVWFKCPGCKRVTLNPAGNLPRDRAIADAHGGAFEYEIYYMEELPKGLEPPEM